MPEVTRRAPSIRTVVAVTMIAPAIALTTALVILSSMANSAISNRLARVALREATGRVESELIAYLSQAERLSAILATQIEHGLLPVREPSRWLPALPEQAASFPAVAIVVFARVDGIVIGTVNSPDGPLILEGGHGVMTERPHRPDSDVAPRTYEFEPTLRPWFLTALAADGPTWTQPYAFVRRNLPGFDVGTSYTRSIERDGELVGVLSVDVTFGAISSFLASMPLAAAGRIAVVDEVGMLVAGSHTPATDGEGSRRASPGAFMPLLDARAGRMDGASIAEIDLDGERYLATATRLVPRSGQEWTVIAAVPQSVVRRDAWTAQLTLATVSIAALALTLIASLWLGRRIVRPVQELRDHAHRVGEGEFARPLKLHAAREFEELATDLNHMAVALAERIALRESISLASQVQQALLPRPRLSRPGLDLHGTSRFCGSIGGDYFDYIELPGRNGMLVAVGDVMGHGVDSALLMATARAALRSEARRTESLGAMLLRVSGVLVQGGAHGHFMTMFLLMIEPHLGRIRWANAGHEAALLITPGADTCVELEGGDIPLGIDPGVVYFEHSMENVPAGSLLMVGTDGLREALDERNEAFGEPRLRAALLEHAERPLEEIASGLLTSVEAHRGARPFDDDVTFVLARLTRTVTERNGR